MTRPIKFRAWDKRTESMADPYGHFIELGDGSVWFNDSDSDSDRLYDQKDNMILMQFTGLQDRNGKDIYEGDIIDVYNNTVISSADPLPHRRVIKANPEDKQLTQAYVDGNCMVSGYTFCGNNSEKFFEVIGNIYENPELLK